MLETIRGELNELTSTNMDNLTDPVVVAVSQELDPYINEAMYMQIEAAKKEKSINKC